MTIPSGHRNQALYWAVKAANAPDGAAWSSRTFQSCRSPFRAQRPRRRRTSWPPPFKSVHPGDLVRQLEQRGRLPRLSMVRARRPRLGGRRHDGGRHDDVHGHRARVKYALLLLHLRVQRRRRSVCASSLTRRRCRRSQLRRQTSAPRPLRARRSGSPGRTTPTTRTASACIGGRCRMGQAMGGRQHDVAGRDEFVDTGLQLSAEYCYFACAYNVGRRSMCEWRAWLAQRDDDGRPPNGSEDRPPHLPIPRPWSRGTHP